MFRRDQKTDPLIDSLVSASTRIQGDVQFSGGLHLDGAVTGSVRAAAGAPSRLVVSESAVIEGSVEAEVVELHGTVRGDISARARVTLGPRACVEGNLHYGAIEMAAGAHIKGKLVKLTGTGTGS
jgi:cytoskeletal protein CcmA (bactofilin family)